MGGFVVSRRDGYVNMLNKYGTAQDNSSAYSYQGEYLTQDAQLIEQYETNGLFAKIIDAPAEEAIKHGFSMGLKNSDIETYVTDTLDWLEWEEKASSAIKWSRLFGGSIIVMLINDGGGIDEPLNWDSIKGLDELRVYERAIIRPDISTLYNYDPKDPLRRTTSRFGLPEYYHVQSIYGAFTVHESRCLVLRNGILPEQTTQAFYRYWGTPEFMRIKKELREAITSHSLSVKMLERSVQAIYSMKDLASLLAAEDGEDQVIKRLQVIDLARGILNSIAIDSEGENYDFKSIALAGVKDVLDSTCNMLSSVSNIPQTILFGRSPAGENSTGESDFENYYNYVERIQKMMLRGNLKTLIDIIIRVGLASGEVVEAPNYKLSFNPLWSKSDKEKAEEDKLKADIAFVKAQTAQIYVEMTSLDPSEVRAGLAKEEEFTIEELLDDTEEDELWRMEDDTYSESNIESHKSETIIRDQNEDGETIQKKEAILRIDEDRWITVENGEHVLIGEGGDVKGGMGGKYNGKNINEISKKETPSSTQNQQHTPSEGQANNPKGASAVQRRGHITASEYFGEINSVEEGAKIIGKDLSESSGENITPTQANRMWDAVVNYTGSDYGDIRRAYSDPKSASKKARQDLKNLEDFIESSPKWEGGELYRGINIPLTNLSDFQPGATISMKGPSSWSDKADNATTFMRGEGASILFKLPSTNKAVSVNHLSSIPGENEVLAPGGVNYSIKSISPQKKRGTPKIIYNIELEEVDDR